MRTSHWPRCTLASRKLAIAATSEPACSGPVGDGAKRPMYGVAAGMLFLWRGVEFLDHLRRLRLHLVGHRHRQLIVEDLEAAGGLADHAAGHARPHLGVEDFVEPDELLVGRRI